MFFSISRSEVTKIEIAAHLKRCRENALAVPNKLKGKILPEVDQNIFTVMCNENVFNRQEAALIAMMRLSEEMGLYDRE